jgi:hypothetical protein
MDMSRMSLIHVFAWTAYLLLGTLFYAPSLAQPANPKHQNPRDVADSLFVRSFASLLAETSGELSAAKNSLAIPSGTILPVRLNTAISSVKSRPGQVITGRLMQDIPLSPGVTMREGGKAVGHIVEVTPATSSAGGRITFTFDQLISSHQTMSITTNLRAIAGFMRIIEAQTPPIGPGESDVYRWLTTVQVGGDVVYGEGGPVTAAEDANQVVGKSVDGGVLSRVRVKEGAKCRGPIDGNDSPQALWVFSSSACGTYGLEHISIAHAGRTSPTGVIVLASDRGNLKISGGAGMLLRVSANGQN